MVWTPKARFFDWPKDGTELSMSEVVQLYENGFAGAKHDDQAYADFVNAMPNPEGEKVVYDYRLTDIGASGLIIPFVHVLEMFPGCWPGAQGQARGDCVSWSARNAALLSMVCDIVSGLPDEKTGKPETRPEVPEEGIKDGVLSTETFYWYRGYDGDGWFCPAAARVACTKAGCVVRKNYPEMGIDLTRYSGRNAGAYGRRAPGTDVQDITDDNPVHEATEARSFEVVRDLLANGHGIHTCGSEGLSNRRDEWGVSRRSGSWAHAMAYIGADDRDVVKRTYGEPLVLDLNSWEKWNSGGRDIIESAAFVPPEKKDKWIQLGIVNASTGNIMIPEGSCWVRWSEMSRREHIAFAGVLGWAAKDLDWNI